MSDDLSPDARSLLDRLRRHEAPPPAVVAAVRQRLHAAPRVAAPADASPPWPVALAVAAAAGVVLALLLAQRGAPPPDERPSVTRFVPAPARAAAPQAPSPAAQIGDPPTQLPPLQLPPLQLSPPTATPQRPRPRVRPDASAATPDPVRDAGVDAATGDGTGVILLSTMPTSMCTVMPGGRRHPTPWRVALPAGRYTVHCVNENLGDSATFDARVVAGATLDLRNRPLAR